MYLASLGNGIYNKNLKEPLLPSNCILQNGKTICDDVEVEVALDGTSPTIANLNYVDGKLEETNEECNALVCEYVSYSEQDMEYLVEKDSENNKCKAIFVELLEEDDEDMKNQIDIDAAVAGICADPTQAGMTVYTLIKESEEMLY